MKLIHMSNQDAPEIPIAATLFYMYLEGQVHYGASFVPLTETVTAYLKLDLKTQRVAKLTITRLQEIFEQFWYDQYQGIDDQRFMQ